MALWRTGALHLVGHDRTLFTEETGLPSNSVHSLAKTRTGSLIVGTAAGAALIRRDNSVHPLIHPLLKGRTIFDLQQSRGDTLWAGTDDGPRSLVLRNDSLLSVTTLPESDLGGQIVYAVLNDSHHRLWFGTDGEGVVRFDGRQSVRLTEGDGLTSNRVFALAEDSLGNIWIGTASGLSCYDGHSLHNLMFAQGFGEIGMHGLMTDGEGVLWVSSFPGVTRIKPGEIRGRKTPPPLYLTDVLFESAHLDVNREAELPPDPAVITFRFAALSFTDERNVRYRYTLEGFDRDWSPPVTSREVRYTHLPSGRYRFNVRACSGEGVWTEAPVSMSFVILPPVWARWWFLTGTVALVISLTYAAYRYRLNKLLQIERTRNRIAMDLHDDLGSTLTRISVMTEVARSYAETNPANAKDYLSRIGEAARDLIERLGDIVWTVDPVHDDLQNVIRRIVQFGEELCEGRGIAFETELLESFESTRLAPEQRRDIYLFFKEGINNLVRHSGATRARFCVRASKRGALLELLDNGSGIPDHARDSGHGLRNLRERGERIGVRFSMGSANGEGTRISLEVKTG
jgi:signal transduction histidine kinase